MTEEKRKDITRTIAVLGNITGMWAEQVAAAKTYAQFDQVIRNFHWQIFSSQYVNSKAFTPEIKKAVIDYVDKYTAPGNLKG